MSVSAGIIQGNNSGQNVEHPPQGRIPIVKVMKEYSKHIADTWNISEPCAQELCDCFEKGYTPFYCADYVPAICAELDVWGVWRVYDFLAFTEELAPKKKRLINALKKNDKLSVQLENHISHLTNEFELDDMLLPERSNPRSKGQLALKKGLGELADTILLQQENDVALEDLAAPFVGKEPSLKKVDDVIAGVKDIIAERFAYDETARTMVREFMYDDGFFDVTQKSKNEKFAKYIGKNTGIHTITGEELLMLLSAEDAKVIRCKLTVQLFRITELLKHHFVVNSDAPGFNLIAESIDDCWIRLLQPIAERDVKIRLRKEAEEIALQEIKQSLDARLSIQSEEKLYLACGATDAKNFAIIVCSDRGRLSGAALEKKLSLDKPSVSERFKQFALRYRPAKVIVLENEHADAAEAIAKISLNAAMLAPEIVFVKKQADQADIATSAWMKKEMADLELPMQRVFATALSYLQPIQLLPKIGTEYFALHPLQLAITPSRVRALFDRLIAESILSKGISAAECSDIFPLVNLDPYITDTLKKEIVSAWAKAPFETKDDLLKVNGITEAAFKNIAGYIMIPNAEFALDRTMAHPDHYSWLADICENLRISPDSLISDPEAVRSFSDAGVEQKLFIEKKLICQLQAGQRFSGASGFFKPKKKYKLAELTEDAVVSGRVTNITPFGVFVNINAVCDGLIHISQLADTYVESADQVVSVNDIVNVRILKVDAKKRRISLSMKGLGQQSPKVSPSQRQLTDLASHFQNR